MKVSPSDPAFLERMARIALANLDREYPNHIQHLMDGDTDAATPRELHPVFCGAYDWHSAVHNYWLLVRLSRLMPEGRFVAEAHAFLERRFNPADVAQECRYFDDPRRASWERPYGLAWLLQLSAELSEWGASDARRWRTTLAPLEAVARERFRVWLPKLWYPIRSGEHSQSAFALGLAYDWSRITGDAPMQALLRAKSIEFHRFDVDSPLAYEPSGQDFLSPVLAEADLLRRVMPPAEYATWLAKFLPQLPRDGTRWLEPAVSRDPSDPKLAHLDGLNLSRAWMLQGMAAGLPVDDARRAALLAAADGHAAAGLAAIREETYEGSHWLPSFAVYLLTGRGLA
ncbi:MAG TPA: DUF2891 domain-containing protein [Gammaproteobacteria bacterium]|nr:DUF2891 domain-containing protein [Gammaproteobacteria bacterium]